MDEENLGFDESEILPDSETVEDTIDNDSDFDAEEVDEPTSESAEPVEEVKETPQQPLFKLKYDREEREVPLEEYTALAQKGLNYERAVERAKQEARDAYIADQGYEWKGKAITTEAEYKQAVEEKRVHDEAMKMAEREGIPEEFAERMLNLEQREAQREKEIQAEKDRKAEEEKQQSEYNDFFNFFESANDRRFDPKTDKLPQEVIEMANNGVPLKYAYMDHYNKQLKTSLITAKQNAANQSKAPVGSITAYGNNAKEPIDPFLEGWDS